MAFRLASKRSGFGVGHVLKDHWPWSSSRCLGFWSFVMNVLYSMSSYLYDIFTEILKLCGHFMVHCSLNNLGFGDHLPGFDLGQRSLVLALVLKILILIPSLVLMRMMTIPWKK